MKTFFSILLSLSFTLFAAEEVVVHLPTDQGDRQNVYVAKVHPAESEHQKMLFEVLETDFRRDGRSHLIASNKAKDAIAHHRDPMQAFQVSRWRTWQAKYVVVPKVKGDELHLQLFDVQNASLKTLYPYKLTGYSLSDRKTMHKASDALHGLIYGKEGFASKKILYAYQPKVEADSSGRWYSEIWEMDYDGKNAVQVTRENHYTITPSFIPNSAKDPYRFVYVTYKQGQPRIYITDRDQPRGKPLIPLCGNQLLPTFSKTGDRIAFICDAGGRADLFVQNFDTTRGVIGKPVQIYSAPGSVQASPSFSPDGKQIAFVSDTSGVPRVYIINLDEVLRDKKKPSPMLITKQCRDNGAPCWSPDGSKIAYSAKTNGIRQIWIYDMKEDLEKQITMGVGNKENPSWAPDSTHLIYNTTSPTFDIFLIDINQTTPVRLTEGPGIKHFPVFEP